jgi:hypothetical protein
MTLGNRLKELARLLFFQGDNWITILGVVLTTGAAVTLVWSWFLELASPHAVHPYVGMVLFVGLPMIFIVGLILIPIGILLRRASLKRAGHLPSVIPAIDFKSKHLHNVLFLVGGLTIVNIVLMGAATVKGVEYMDSSRFCGLTCHTPMSMEYRAFENSPHSRVGCAQCHIGPGAESFMKAKLAGVRQVFGVLFNSYSRPIPSPVETLRPARETCEDCHWPQKFVGNKILVRTHYGDDAESTPATTVLMLKIGGLSNKGNTGIHGRHLDNTARVTYLPTDGKRQTIGKVTYRDDNGQTVEFVNPDVKMTPEQLAKTESRKMDCVDCHNRPTHAFEMPEQAVDRIITEGSLSRELPFAKKTAVEIIKRDYKDQAAAAIAIPQAVADFYQKNYPEVFAQKHNLVVAGGNAIKEAFLRNVSPEMKLTWGTHPNHIGHGGNDLAGGCFRCHDGNHTTKEGRTITSSCDTSHTILAQDEKDPKILKELGTS